MKEIIYYCDRCNRRITEEEADASYLKVFITPKFGNTHLCSYCFSEYKAIKAVHYEELLKFMHGEVFANEGE